MNYVVDGECTHSSSRMQSIQIEQEGMLQELYQRLGGISHWLFLGGR